MTEEEKLENQEKEIYEKKMQVYLKHLEKHMDKSKERQEYAIKQFDTLMVALSTAGLGFVSSYIKEMNGNLILAYTSQIGFLVCLFSNLFSHIASMKCNKSAMLNAKEEFEAETYDSLANDQEAKIRYEIIQNRRNREIAFLSNLVKGLNISAFVFLTSSVICFIVFTIKH